MMLTSVAIGVLLLGEAPLPSGAGKRVAWGLSWLSLLAGIAGLARGGLSKERLKKPRLNV
eukprot:CAMPEP_0170161140 /NCGR_PEP_ID=MMETSP0033_2-20121228/75330_1 /TAXON_ID=195969 /ORGANISM="Dolichomastix tenuilepis, Strain CCMP3274" /LENGTH=59 /DNA_ID=CAMNT_0010398735 /DNA_START=100 /DNA_END=279 /DNA_ORIENTATION=-